MNNPYIISVGSAVVAFLALVLMKRSKKEDVNRLELLKISSIVALIVFGCLFIYEKPPEPILSEPFISSSEF